MESKKTRRIQLKKKIETFGRAAIAYSGGVDSTLLLKFCLDVLGRKNTLAILVKTELIPEYDLQNALQTLKQLGCRYAIIESNVLEIDRVFLNPEDRCYWCKKEILSAIITEAKTHDLANVLDGTNYDDIKTSSRPGVRALKELGVTSPFLESGFTKDDIRIWAKDLNLLCWDRPSGSCLATRIPYNEQLTRNKLGMVEKAEDILRSFSFNCCRVRIYQNTARIELKAGDLKKILDRKIRISLIKRFKEIGFLYVTLDLEGYRSGSMDY